MKKNILIASTLTLTIGLAIGAFAHSGAMGIVKERMDGMMAMGKAMKSLAMIMKGAKDYDVATVEGAAKILANHSGEKLTTLFPEDEKKQKVSVAKDEIWTNWEEFEKYSMELHLYSEALARSAGKGLGGDTGSAMSSSSMTGTSGMGMTSEASIITKEMLAEMSPDEIFPMIAKTCSSCHSKFRAEK